MRHIACMMLAMLVLAAAYPGERAAAQGKAELIHQRGRIWENVANDGWIGSLGAWDYLVSAPLGLFPGFTGFQHPWGTRTTRSTPLRMQTCTTSGRGLDRREGHEPAGASPDLRADPDRLRALHVGAPGGRLWCRADPGAAGDEAELHREPGVRPAAPGRADHRHMEHERRHYRHAAVVRVELSGVSRLHHLRLRLQEYRPDRFDTDAAGRDQPSGFPADPERRLLRLPFGDLGVHEEPDQLPQRAHRRPGGGVRMAPRSVPRLLSYS